MESSKTEAFDRAICDSNARRFRHTEKWSFSWRNSTFSVGVAGVQRTAQNKGAPSGNPVKSSKTEAFDRAICDSKARRFRHTEKWSFSWRNSTFSVGVTDVQRTA